MSRIALYHLETLLWIARLGTFGAAAERLNTTQPSVSARIRELEDQVGIKLFRKEGRRMVLTVKGRLLVEQCEPLWNELQNTLLSAESFSKAAGIVKLGSGEIAATLWLPSISANVKEALPNVILEIDVDLTINLHQKIEAGLLDVALVVGPVDTPALLAKRVARVNMAWYASRSVAEKLDAQCDWALIPVWSLSRPSHLYQVMVEALREAKLNSRAINTCNNVRTLIDIVAAGAGIGILPSPMVDPLLENGGLVRISPFLPAKPVDFFAVVRRTEDEPIVLDIFRRLQMVEQSHCPTPDSK